MDRSSSHQPPDPSSGGTGIIREVPDLNTEQRRKRRNRRRLFLFSFEKVSFPFPPLTPLLRVEIRYLREPPWTSVDDDDAIVWRQFQEADAFTPRAAPPADPPASPGGRGRRRP